MGDKEMNGVIILTKQTFIHLLLGINIELSVGQILT